MTTETKVIWRWHYRYDESGKWTRVENPAWVAARVGDRNTVWAGAPGIGKMVYEITRKDKDGCYGRILENTMRELYPWEVQ